MSHTWGGPAPADNTTTAPELTTGRHHVERPNARTVAELVPNPSPLPPGRHRQTVVGKFLRAATSGGAR